jgi:heterodisulfide reductase subunit A-like polyferredoxin
MKRNGLLLCVCQGTCPSFKEMDIFEILNAIRREKLVDFVGIHPQLCADDGDEFLKTLLANKEIDKLFVAGCDPRMQQKMFRDAFREAGFDSTHLYAVDIRNMNTAQALEATKKLIQETLSLVAQEG